MPKNVLTLPVLVKPLQEKSFVPRIALPPNLPKGENVSADIPGVGTEVNGRNAQRTNVGPYFLGYSGKFTFEGGDHEYSQAI